MEKDKIYIKSIESLKKLLAETPREEIDEIISSCEDLVLEGPTFDEYLDILQYELAEIEWGMSFRPFLPLENQKLSEYEVVYNQDFLQPPREKPGKKAYKKDSALIAESFFLLSLYHGRSN